jgi:1,4-dihydroxy-2-naphthoyl-CoA hydrolase
LDKCAKKYKSAVHVVNLAERLEKVGVFMENIGLSTKGTVIEALGIKFVEISEDKVVATMPVGELTRQPYGTLHGGSSVVLAETVASYGTYNFVDKETELAVGLEINANHIRAKQSGIVTAIATPLHKGKSTMVWDIKIVDEQEKLICVSRCTVAIVKRRQINKNEILGK